MSNKYKFSVWQVIDERGTVRGTYETSEVAHEYRLKLAALKENDHGTFIEVKEVKVYGGEK